MHHILAHWSGGDGGFIYDIYSGIIGVLLGCSFFGTAYLLYKKHKCHTCFRVSRHSVADGAYAVCSRHWRQINGWHRKHKIDIEHIKAHHEQHQAKTAP